jgi:SAM-dependent methyltransferase
MSHQPSDEMLAALGDICGQWLHLGAGATRERFAKSVELETAIFRHTDIVGSADRLPFRDCSLGGALALNVFEHLAEPEASARELHRVLVPGAPLIVQTAFLQPLHADPLHFYNATESGIRRWFRQFRIDDLSVPPNLHPAYGLSWQASELLWGVNPGLSTKLEILTIAELAAFWRDPSTRHGAAWGALLELPPERQRVLAAGFQLRATRE